MMPPRPRPRSTIYVCLWDGRERWEQEKKPLTDSGPQRTRPSIPSSLAIANANNGNTAQTWYWAWKLVRSSHPNFHHRWGGWSWPQSLQCSSCCLRHWWHQTISISRWHQTISIRFTQRLEEEPLKLKLFATLKEEEGGGNLKVLQRHQSNCRDQMTTTIKSKPTRLPKHK